MSNYPRISIRVKVCFLILKVLFSPILLSQSIVKMTSVSWPPHFGEKLKDGGPVVAVTREAFKRVDLELKFY